LPHSEDERDSLASDLGIERAALDKKIQSTTEFNPMLGHRGCRLAVTFPEIYEVQVRAIIEAACHCAKDGIRTQPEIMIPLVAGMRELASIRERVDTTAKEVMVEQGRRIKFTVGTMIEVPRAALRADQIAKVADFFSFGTNDLTQMTMALSRDDSGKFLPAYVEQGLMLADPFVTLDREGVGELVRHGVAAGRSTSPDLKIGICGEHGGDPRSVQFCDEIGLDYVSCSPFRVPIARLAAARAVLEQ